MGRTGVAVIRCALGSGTGTADPPPWVPSHTNFDGDRASSTVDTNSLPAAFKEAANCSKGAEDSVTKRTPHVGRPQRRELSATLGQGSPCEVAQQRVAPFQLLQCHPLVRLVRDGDIAGAADQCRDAARGEAAALGAERDLGRGRRAGQLAAEPAQNRCPRPAAGRDRPGSPRSGSRPRGRSRARSAKRARRRMPARPQRTPPGPAPAGYETRTRNCSGWG